MKIYNKEKTNILIEPNLDAGYLMEDTIVLRTVPAQEEVKEQFHYEVVKEYPNGGKEVKKVVDVEYKPFIPEHEEKENIYVYIPYTLEELIDKQKQELRKWRQQIFEIIDCAVWYDMLTLNEKEEVKRFRLGLLDITKTLLKPEIPACVKERMK